MTTKDRILKNCEGDRKLAIELLGNALDLAEDYIRTGGIGRDAVIDALDEIYNDDK